MSPAFLLLNAIFFGVIALIYTLKWLFSDRGIKSIEVVLWIGSFIWSAYCITQVMGV